MAKTKGAWSGGVKIGRIAIAFPCVAEGLIAFGLRNVPREIIGPSGKVLFDLEEHVCKRVTQAFQAQFVRKKGQERQGAQGESRAADTPKVTPKVIPRSYPGSAATARSQGERGQKRLKKNTVANQRKQGETRNA